MSKTLLALVLSGTYCAAAFSQGGMGITESTDPAKAAQVEQHAQQLQQQQQEEAAKKAEAKPAKSATHHASQGFFMRPQRRHGIFGKIRMFVTD